MIQLLKALMNVQISPDQIVFTGKWLMVVPFMFFNTWVYWRALKSFGKIK